jgi:hypothetical protein
VESFGSRLRDELPAVEAFTTLLEAQVLVEDWTDNRGPVRHVEKFPDLTPEESGQELHPLTSTGSEVRSPRLNTRASRPRDSHRRGPA